MPHAALWVVQLQGELADISLVAVSMPHAALWVVQLGTIYLRQNGSNVVSMPHAALWVVQPSDVRS